MIGGDHVHAPNVNFLIQKPFTNAVMRTWMALNISLLIGFFTEERVIMPACIDEQNIAILYLRALLNIIGGEEAEVVKHIAQVHDNSRSVAPLDGNLVNRFPFRHKMPRRIEMCTHVVGSLNILRVNPLLRLALDIFHFKRWIEGPK